MGQNPRIKQNPKRSQVGRHGHRRGFSKMMTLLHVVIMQLWAVAGRACCDSPLWKAVQIRKSPVAGLRVAKACNHPESMSVCVKNQCLYVLEVLVVSVYTPW